MHSNTARTHTIHPKWEKTRKPIPCEVENKRQPASAAIRSDPDHGRFLEKTAPPNAQLRINENTRIGVCLYKHTQKVKLI